MIIVRSILRVSDIALLNHSPLLVIVIGSSVVIVGSVLKHLMPFERRYVLCPGCRGVYTDIGIELNHRLFRHRSVFRGDEHHSIGCLGSVYGGRGGILQDYDILHVSRIDHIGITLDSVNQNERTGRTEIGLTPDVEFCLRPNRA